MLYPFDEYSKDDLRKVQVHVTESTKTQKPGYEVHYGFLSPYTGMLVRYKFTFLPSILPPPEYVKQLAEKVLRSRKLESLTDKTRYGPNKVYPREIRAEMNAKYRQVRINKKHDLDDINQVPDSDYSKNNLYEEPNILERDHDSSGRTAFVAGRSYSGKTYFLVQQLNMLKNKKRGGPDKHTANRPMYEKIIIMTNSPNAEPFRSLYKELNIRIIPFYLPKIVMALKRINDKTDNKSPFLIVLDDVFSSLKGRSFKDLILTMRNSNITTVCLSQYLKHCEPQTRNSFHDIYITKFKPEEWKYYISSCLEADVEEIIGHQPNINHSARKFEEFVGTDIVHHNVRKDTLHLIKRDMK